MMNSAMRDIESGKTVQIELNDDGVKLQQMKRRGIQCVTIPYDDIIGCRCWYSPNYPSSALLTIYAYPRHLTSGSGSVQDSNEDCSKQKAQSVRKRQSCTLGVDESPHLKENLLAARKWKDSVILKLRRDELTQKSSSTTPRPRLRVLAIVNPYGGTGEARKLFDTVARPLMQEADMDVLTIETEMKGHARKIMEEIEQKELEKLDAIVVCGGDGIIHEVATGLFSRQKHSDIPIGILPGGTGNAVSAALLSASKELDAITPAPVLMRQAAFNIARRRRRNIDAVLVSTGRERLLSALSVCYGLIADIDIESEKYRSLGRLRITIGSVVRIVGLKHYRVKFSYIPSQKVDGARLVSKVRSDNSDRSRLRRAFSWRQTRPKRDDVIVKERSISYVDNFSDALSLNAAEDPNETRPNGNKEEREDSGFVSSNENIQKEIKSETKEEPQGLKGVKLKFKHDPAAKEWKSITTEVIVWCALNVSHLSLDAIACPMAQPDDGVIWILVIRKGISKIELLKLMTKLETSTGFEEMMRNPFVDLYPCKAFQLEALDKHKDQGVLTVDGEAIENESQIKIVGEVIEKILPVMASG